MIGQGGKHVSGFYENSLDKNKKRPGAGLEDGEYTSGSSFKDRKSVV